MLAKPWKNYVISWVTTLIKISCTFTLQAAEDILTNSGKYQKYHFYTD